MRPNTIAALCVAAALALLAGCRSGDGPASTTATPTPSAASTERQSREESGPGWGFRAEWPARLARHPTLLAAVEEHIDAARREIEGFAAPSGAPSGADSEPVEGQDPSWPPVETQMNWSIPVETPTLVTAVLEGYTYSGGAHGMPLHAALHLDPVTGRLLSPADLFRDESGWQALAQRVRAALYERVEEQLAETPAEFRDDAREGSRQWIDEGTAPGPTHLGLFVPQVGARGEIESLLLVFPPYQVGPYAEGTHSVAIPLAELRDHLSSRWAAALGVARR
jgi:hypothetical protein